MTIATRLPALQAALDKARRNSPLAGHSTTILGACKGQSEAAITEAIKQGLTLFGENRVQEAQGKWEGFAHLIRRSNCI
jgi:uncharacterized pyridoxal phosphate-containing UPF0001 family protein